MKTLLALRDSRAIAYLMVSRACNKPGLIESGGDLSAVETLINRAFSELEPDSFYVAYDN